MTKQCLIVFDRQTFPVWTGLKGRYFAEIQSKKTDLQLKSYGETFKF